MSEERKVSDVKFREDLYPRIDRNPVLVQTYRSSIDVLPPIEVNQHGELIDGWHRWTAFKEEKRQHIPVIITVTESDIELLKLAIKRNASFGMQLSDKDKESMAVRLYGSGHGIPEDEIAQILSVSDRQIRTYLSDTKGKLEAERNRKIFGMWLSCHTQDEIAAAVDVTQKNISEKIEVLYNLEELPKGIKLAALFQPTGEEGDIAFEPPIYNVWAFAKKTNAGEHFGNSEQRILENLLYLYTNPFDIVIDPFGGGGSTIDVCKKRSRRYWVSDRLPVERRAHEIRKLDVTQELPALTGRWGEVRLVYLDPPYWKQAEGKYSKDETDFANMPLDKFTDGIGGLIKSFAKKLQPGAVIAMLMQPTQWLAENRCFTDHISDILSVVGNKKLTIENRVSCPYSTEQCTPQMVEWAKQEKKLLVISRELVIWKIV